MDARHRYRPDCRALTLSILIKGDDKGRVDQVLSCPKPPVLHSRRISVSNCLPGESVHCYPGFVAPSQGIHRGSSIEAAGGTLDSIFLQEFMRHRWRRIVASEGLGEERCWQPLLFKFLFRLRVAACDPMAVQLIVKELGLGLKKAWATAWCQHSARRLGGLMPKPLGMQVAMAKKTRLESRESWPSFRRPKKRRTNRIDNLKGRGGVCRGLPSQKLQPLHRV